MADSKISGYTESSTPAGTYVVWAQDAGGTIDRKVQLQNLVYPVETITARTDDTTPDGAADYILTYDASGNIIAKTLLKNAGAQYIQADSYQDNPSDSTTYYFGAFPSAIPATSGGLRRIYIPKACKILQCYVTAYVTGTIGSGENVAVSVRVDNTTDASVGNITLSAAGRINTLNNTGMSQAVAAGSYIEMKLVTPAFATNPTGVLWTTTIMLG